ncbi:MAG: energy transducer TonB, partial [Candidatus Binatia bacterium]
AETRQRLLNEAMERVRNRIKTRQAETEGGETVPSQASRETPAPHQDPFLLQSAKTESAQDVKQAEYNTYLEGIKRSVFRAWEPEQASRNKEQGRVVLEFTILRDGRLENMRILRSSGYPSLDREAMRSVKAVSPFRPLPERIGLSELSIRYTFNYSLK